MDTSHLYSFHYVLIPSIVQSFSLSSCYCNSLRDFSLALSLQLLHKCFTISFPLPNKCPLYSVNLWIKLKLLALIINISLNQTSDLSLRYISNPWSVESYHLKSFSAGALLHIIYFFRSLSPCCWKSVLSFPAPFVLVTQYQITEKLFNPESSEVIQSLTCLHYLTCFLLQSYNSGFCHICPMFPPWSPLVFSCVTLSGEIWSLLLGLGSVYT